MGTPAICTRSICLAMALLGSGAASFADVGVRVVLQEASARGPDGHVLRVIADHPNAVGDAMQAAWTEARPRICKALLNELRQRRATDGRASHGASCLLDETAALSVANPGPNALRATLAAEGFLESPFTARLLLTISVQPNRYRTLRVDTARFELTSAALDSRAIERAENAVDAIGGVGALAGRFDAALAPVNDKLRGKSAAVRIAVWAEPGAIVVAFGTRPVH